MEKLAWRITLITALYVIPASGGVMDTNSVLEQMGGELASQAVPTGKVLVVEHVDNSSLFGRKRQAMNIQHDTIRIRRFLQEKPVDRAQRPTTIVATVVNVGDVDAELRPRLVLPKGVQLIGPAMDSPVRIGSRAEKLLAWQIEATEAMQCELLLQIDAEAETVASASLSMQFLPPVNISKQRYIPEPAPVSTPILIGAHHCPLWEADKPRMWDNVLKHPERTPALGFYSQENPEVSDWETKWAVEHGISFFIYCWYRTSQGGPVEMQFSSAIHDALFKSKFVDKMKFTIMWENQRRGKSGVADEADLMENLLPFWIDNYFKTPEYYTIGGKPVVVYWDYNNLDRDFIDEAAKNGETLKPGEGVKRALAITEKLVKEAGLPGVCFIDMYHGWKYDPSKVDRARAAGSPARLQTWDHMVHVWQIFNPELPEAHQALEEIRKFLATVPRRDDVAGQGLPR